MCGCGQLTEKAKCTNLRDGHIKREHLKYLHGHNPAHLKHGATRGQKYWPEYIAYHNAIARCTNPKRPDFSDYGGRGVRFLFKSFEEFLTEVGPKPSPSHSIDRYPDNNRHYEKGNVRWATKAEQAANRRKRRTRDELPLGLGGSRPPLIHVGASNPKHRIIEQAS
jgi:hypothetical protein